MQIERQRRHARRHHEAHTRHVVGFASPRLAGNNRHKPVQLCQLKQFKNTKLGKALHRDTPCVTINNNVSTFASNSVLGERFQYIATIDALVSEARTSRVTLRRVELQI
ncbi:hypothetical protein PQQ65_31125 [Paraburkholderia strydomiana]|uniref:hypothetical protein n=1 Tax=Paraburkholderia strydomiana TaxID=1245417 RepID=UPI0038B74EF6